MAPRPIAAHRRQVIAAIVWLRLVVAAVAVTWSFTDPRPVLVVEPIIILTGIALMWGQARYENYAQTLGAVAIYWLGFTISLVFFGGAVSDFFRVPDYSFGLVLFMFLVLSVVAFVIYLVTKLARGRRRKNSGEAISA